MSHLRVSGYVRFLKYFWGAVLCLMLGACAAGAPTTAATRTATAVVRSSTPAPIVSPQPSETSAPPSPSPVKTRQPDPAELATQQAYYDLSTKVALFPVHCARVGANSLSPDGEWLATTCSGESEQTLQIVNRSGQQWIFHLEAYIATKDLWDGIPRGGLYPQYWSVDGAYLYFVSRINLDGGGACFYHLGAQGLYQVRLKDGSISTVLPTRSISSGGWPEISFSPTGRRLTYTNSDVPVIMDLVTGQETVVAIEPGFHAGDLRWSPDGLELAYSICQPDEVTLARASAIKIFSIQKNESRTILQAEQKFFRLFDWSDNNVLELEVQDMQERTINALLIDLGSGKLMTATPTP